jgi:hypothetical protein
MDQQKVSERTRMKNYALRTFPKLLNTVFSAEVIAYNNIFLLILSLNLDVYVYWTVCLPSFGFSGFFHVSQ